MAQNGYTERLLAIIEAQNRIAATKLGFDASMALVAEQAQALTGADAAVIELKDGDNVLYSTAAGDRDARAPGQGRALSVAVRRDALQIGEVRVFSLNGREFDDDDLRTLELLSAMVTAQIWRANGHANDGDDARKDRVTGLGNQLAYQERLEAESSRARRHDDRLTLCRIDIDGLDQIRERHGHPAADEVLRQVGQILARLRAEDAAFRIGGHQFAVVLPATSSEEAAVAVERLAAHIAARAFGAVSASFGLADAPPQPTELHTAAEASLRDAKADRGQVASAR